MHSEHDERHLVALQQQSASCGALGSAMYREVLAALAVDFDELGITHTLLSGSSERPVHDATPLRLMGGLHRVVLRGDDPVLAQHYPSVGGAPGPGLVPEVLAALHRHGDELRTGLTQQVQTNEVGRSVVPLSLMHWLPSIGVRQTQWIEIGASAGLNLCFDRFGADTGGGVLGDPASAVQFAPSWFDAPPQVLAVPATVTTRHGVDAYPIDIRDDAGVERLLSFVWPDQVERFGRLRAAIGIARREGVTVQRSSADTWLEEVLPTTGGSPVVVFHSIVWQYLGDPVRARVRAALEARGATATEETPLAWVRMEPAGPVADIQATVWRGGEPQRLRLGDVGYHGQHLRWDPQHVDAVPQNRPWSA